MLLLFKLMYSIEKQQLEEENKPIEINLHPISKWKRILVFLADFFINFFLTFILINVLVNPIASAVTKANSRGEQAKEAERIRDDVLYGNGLLFYKNGESNKYDYDSNLKYTYKRWLSYYALDEMNNEYGPDISNEVIYVYYHNLSDRVDNTTYINIFKNENDSLKYFDIEEDITLKPEVKSEVYLAFVPNENLGGQGEKMYNNLSSMFAKMYRYIMEDIFEKDLTYNGENFGKYQQIIEDLAKYDGWTVTICTLIAYVLSFVILHIVYPLIAKNGHTISMSIMKVERVGINNLRLLSKTETLLTSGYALILEMGFLLFIPLTYGSSFVYALSYPLLNIFTFTAIFLMLVSLFFIIFNGFNRSLSDVCSRSVLISTEDLDELERAKTYSK